MMKLGIHLQDGFSDDEVVVKINGEVRLHRSHVSTRRVLGLAEHTKMDIDDGPLSIEISVPNRGLGKHIEIEANGEVHLGISLAGDGIRVINRKTPFGYG